MIAAIIGFIIGVLLHRVVVPEVLRMARDAAAYSKNHKTRDYSGEMAAESQSMTDYMRAKGGAK